MFLLWWSKKKPTSNEHLLEVGFSHRVHHFRCWTVRTGDIDLFWYARWNVSTKNLWIYLTYLLKEPIGSIWTGSLIGRTFCVSQPGSYSSKLLIGVRGDIWCGLLSCDVPQRLTKGLPNWLGSQSLSWSFSSFSGAVKAVSSSCFLRSSNLKGNWCHERANENAFS